MAQPAVYTIGHSNRDPAEVVALLREAGVELLVDVRSFPRSRSNPAFNEDRLPAALEPAGIAYEHWPVLGGRRNLQPEVPDAVNGLWRNRSFHNYADHALGAEFQAALSALLRRARSCRPALMCAEAVWWRCHRRIIADHLLERGCPVFHIMGEGRVEAAKPTPGARPGPDGAVVYPAAEASADSAS